MRANRALTTIVLCMLLVFALSGCGEQSSGGGKPTTQDVVLKMVVRGAVPQIASSMRVGDTVKVKDTGTVLGKISAVEATASPVSVPTAEGGLVLARSPQFKDITLTIEGRAVVSEQGFDFGGEFIYVNNDIRYLTPLAVFGGIITSITPK